MTKKCENPAQHSPSQSSTAAGTSRSEAHIHRTGRLGHLFMCSLLYQHFGDSREEKRPFNRKKQTHCSLQVCIHNECFHCLSGEAALLSCVPHFSLKATFPPARVQFGRFLHSRVPPQRAACLKVCDTNTSMAWRRRRPAAWSVAFGQTRGTQFSFLCSHVLGFNSGGFDFCDGIALMTPLTGQLVACSLLTSRFRLEPGS